MIRLIVQTNQVKNSSNPPTPSPEDPTQSNDGTNPPIDVENATNNETTTSEENNTTATGTCSNPTNGRQFQFIPAPFDYRNLTRFNRKPDYEFFEVYNNTNQPITLNNYAFHYVYTDGSSTDIRISHS